MAGRITSMLGFPLPVPALIALLAVSSSAAAAGLGVRPPARTDAASPSSAVQDVGPAPPAERPDEGVTKAPALAGDNEDRPERDSGETDTTPTGEEAKHSLLREDDFSWAVCRLALHHLGTEAAPAEPVSGGDPACGIDRPLKVSAILPGVTLAGAPLMRCATAYALARWLKNFVDPAASRLSGAPNLATLELGTGFQCRERVGNMQETLSEHAFGNAIDITAFGFDDGRRLMVGQRDDGSEEQAFLAAARWSACMDFSTVLGPGSNAAHADHLHLDIKERPHGYRICQ